MRTSRPQVPQASDGWWLVVVVLGLGAFWSSPYWWRGLTMPIGPDVPVYLWWARLAASEGLGAAGHRPGAAAAILSLSSVLNIQLLPVIAALLIAAAVSLALAGGILIRAATGSRLAWLLGTILVGLYARFLLWGFVANLILVALFLAAMAVIAQTGRRGVATAAFLLVGAGLAHPYFYLLSVIVILVAVFAERLRDGLPAPSEFASSALKASVFGGAAAALGVLATYLGPQARFDIAPAGLLRRAGLASRLPAGYRLQIQALVRSDGGWIAVEAALAIVARLEGPVGRLLGAWGAVTVTLLPVGLIFPYFAGQRLVFFGFFLPLLAAVALSRLARLARPLVFGVVLFGVLMVVVAEAATWWLRVDPFFTETQLQRANAASAVIQSTDDGTPIVTVVSGPGAAPPLAAKALNALRAAAPPERIDDIYVYFGPLDDIHAGRASAVTEPLRSLQIESLEQIQQVGREPIVVVLAPFNSDEALRNDPRLTRFSTGVFVARGFVASGGRSDAVEVPTPGAIVTATILVFALLGASGYGWARAAVDRSLTAVALAPAFGTAVAVTSGTISVTVGRGLATPLTVFVFAAVAAGGYVAAWRAGSPRRPKDAGSALITSWFPGTG